MIVWYDLVILAAILSGASQVIEKKLLKYEHALAFTLTVNGGAALLSLSLIPFADFHVSLLQWIMILIFSITLSSSYWILARLFRHGQLSIAGPVYNVLPIMIVVAIAAIIFGEFLSITKYVAIVIIIIATYLVMLGVKKAHIARSKVRLYNHMVVTASVLSAINYLILKYAMTSMNVFTFFIISGIMTTILLSFEMLGRSAAYRRSAVKAVTQNMGLLIVMAIFTVGYRLLFYSAVITGAISLAVPLNSAIVVSIAVISGGVFFGEKNIRTKLLLSVLMIVSLYFLVA
ncbi:MAG: EamA family transporter [Candidatus Marsarchaeota archaeon]|nr:EamA family transporter [Candidatus Marsarchaeota archaeon]